MHLVGTRQTRPVEVLPVDVKKQENMDILKMGQLSEIAAASDWQHYQICADIHNLASISYNAKVPRPSIQFVKPKSSSSRPLVQGVVSQSALHPSVLRNMQTTVGPSYRVPNMKWRLDAPN